MPWRGPSEPGEFPTLGYDLGEWIEANCVIPDGYRQGEPYRLTDEMWRFLIRYYRICPGRGYRCALCRDDEERLHYYGGQLRRSQKWGKDPFGAGIILAEALGPARPDGWTVAGEPVGAPYPTPYIPCLGTSEEQPLALDTPVPTPTGWSTVGDLRVGDVVLDHVGTPVMVARATAVILGHTCFRVSFSDGESVVASADHAWDVEDGAHRGPRRRRATLSTAELARGCRVPRGGMRYRLPVVRWELPDVEGLMVEPYLLGLWLGDGRTADSVIAADVRHRSELDAIIAPLLGEYERVVWAEAGGYQATVRIRNVSRHASTGPSFRERLRGLGVLGDKHIPARYLRAGTKQRLALLQGLIDSDGHVERNGRATFTNINRRLVDDVAELLTTLGYQWVIRADSWADAWRLQFVPDDEPVARLSHKAERQRARTAWSRSAWRYVTAVEPVASVPVRCVGIDTAEHLFLVGRRGVPTHNTDNTYRPLLDMIRRGPLVDLPGMDAGETRVKLPNGGEVEPVTASARARLGQRMTFATLTESHLWAGPLYRRLAGAVKRNIAGMDGRWLELTNAWDPTEGSEAQVTAETGNPRVLVDTVEPHRVEDLLDEEELYRELLRQYGDSARERGGWVNIRGRIMHEVRSMSHLEADRRRFFLNEIVVGESVFVNPERWDKQARPVGLDAREQIALGFDGSKYRDATALIACRMSDGHLVALGVWERPADAARDWKVPSAEVDRRLRDVFEAYRVTYLYADPYRWQDYLDAWSALWPKQVVEFATNVEQRMDKAIERFTTAFDADQVTHDGTPVLARHSKNAVLVKGARKKPRPGEDETLTTHYLKMAKRGDGMLIDAAVAAVLAYEARGQAVEDGLASSNYDLLNSAW